MITTKRIISYVKVTYNYGMIYTKNKNNQNYEVFGYFDYDRMETKMTGKALLPMCLNMVMQWYHGVLRRKNGCTIFL